MNHQCFTPDQEKSPLPRAGPAAQASSLCSRRVGEAGRWGRRPCPPDAGSGFWVLGSGFLGPAILPRRADPLGRPFAQPRLRPVGRPPLTLFYPRSQAPAWENPFPPKLCLGTSP